MMVKTTLICAAFFQPRGPVYLFALLQIATRTKIIGGNITKEVTYKGTFSATKRIPTEMPISQPNKTPNTQYVMTNRTSPHHNLKKNFINLTPTTRAKRAVTTLRAAEITIADTAVPGTTPTFLRRLSNFGGLLLGYAGAQRWFGGGSTGGKKHAQEYCRQKLVHWFPLLDFDSIGYMMALGVSNTSASGLRARQIRGFFASMVGCEAQ